MLIIVLSKNTSRIQRQQISFSVINSVIITHMLSLPTGLPDKTVEGAVVV